MKNFGEEMNLSVAQSKVNSDVISAITDKISKMKIVDSSGQKYEIKVNRITYTNYGGYSGGFDMEFSLAVMPEIKENEK